MDLSALIFVALAVAWAVYLIPMALKHSDDAARSRRIDRFSGSLRVLARRDAVRVEEAPAAAGPDKIQVRRPAAASAAASAAAAVPAPTRAGGSTRTASAVAARRRRRVLGTLALANVALVALASAAVIAWPYVAITAGLLVAWLVACRLMVKRERSTAATRSATRSTARDSTAARAARPARRPAVATAGDTAPGEPEVLEVGDATEDIPVVPAAETDAPEAPAAPAAAEADPRDPSSWDLRPVPLPTYVGKATAGRAVRTIDLESTGVWTSGRKADDSQIAREADEAARAAKSDREATEHRRATGS